MRGAMVILVAMVIIGIILYAIDVIYYRKRRQQINTDTKTTDTDEGLPAEQAETSVEDGGICCGMHTVCEKTNLSPLTGEIVYYDDEELDRYRGRDADSYSSEEVEEFRDVLLTLLPEDVAGWSRSIQVREINLPTEVRDELLMIVSELRQTY
ncbi:MAG: phospholipase [Bacteroides sp.]|nr:phospholipase [Bacteroides sp.]